MNVNLTVLGSGSSPGVPYLGCSCDVCTSVDSHNKRTRTAFLVEINGVRFLVDTPPDLRAQLLREKIYRVDAVLFTHAHADHICGIDDLRAFRFLMGGTLDCFAAKAVVEHIRTSFAYIFDNEPETGGGKPSLAFHEVTGSFEFRGVKVEEFHLPHGPNRNTSGYLIGGAVAVLLDCSSIPDAVIERVKGVPIAIIDLVQKEPGHATHLTWTPARDYARRIGAALTIYSHFGHEIEHGRDQKQLDAAESLAYDGMKIHADEHTNPHILTEEAS